ncbi:MAG: PAS domain S-box protein [Synechococcales cyanobacterium K44_A2020_017]|nr:PAS domain S-box protein [Synechococcales cyanobacterium K32_A2020_035]MBF2094108.1 PAS domain S-box protein [Synechococcales cyanobacterium K44_A2020_017]
MQPNYRDLPSPHDGGAMDLCSDVVRNIQLGLTIWHLAEPNDPTSLELVAFNPAAVHVTGVPLNQRVGDRLIDCFPDLVQQDPTLLNHYAAIAGTGRISSHRAESYYSTATTVGIYRVQVFPLPRQCVGLGFEDMTEHRLMEQSLRESDRRYETLAQLLPVGIFRTDHEGNRLYVNQRWCAITGIHTPEASGSQWAEALHPTDRDRVVAEWQRSVQAQESFQLEYRFLRADQTVTWVLGQAVPQTNEAGEVVGYIGTITDISDRKQAELALKDSEERFRATFEQAAVGIAHVSRQGQWLRVNQTLCNILGYSREELMALRYQDVTPPEYLECDRQIVDQLFQGEAETCNLEKEYVRRDGSRIWVKITASAVRSAYPADVSIQAWLQSPLDNDDRTEQVQYLLAVIEDISERKRSEIALRERAEELTYINALLSRTTALLKHRNEELDQFAYVSSHDLKAPLRAIANLSEWIEEDLGDKLPPENQRQMQLLRGRVHRMEALINGLLEYSRVGRIEIQEETIDLNDLLLEVIDLLDPPPAFILHLPPPVPTFTTKRLLLRQVLANLISNAIQHHHHDHGNIFIHIKELETTYEFAIADDGPGIDPKYHSKIFTIFQTLKSRDVNESTGIGLAIVKKIIEAEGCSIWLKSQEQEGCTIYFTWPKAILRPS